MVYTPAAVPTVSDARRAADVLTEAGALKVLLFGSVARGEATEGSDIDLVGLLYLGFRVIRGKQGMTRTPLAFQLEAAAAAAAGFPVAVFVTDLPDDP